MTTPSRLLVHGAAALALLGAAVIGRAADAAGLGSVFRPQGADAATGQGGAPGASDADVSSGLRIVIAGKKRAVASIDGRLVHVGDTVNGMRVAHIGAQEVLLVGEGGAKERLFVNPLVVNSKRPVQPARSGAEGVRR